MAEDCVARRLEVNGIVQGVGFRPFVYNLANHYELTGQVANTSSGVIIHIEGTIPNIESFSKDLTAKHPPALKRENASKQSHVTILIPS